MGIFILRKEGIMFVQHQPYRKLLICFLFFSICAHEKREKNQWITIFVHGIMSIQSHLSVGLICKLFCDNVLGSMYADTIHEMRNDNFFQHNQLMQQVGLHPILHIGQSAQTAPEVLATLYDISAKSVNSSEENIYYTFGWSGLLSACERQHAANEFYLKLYDEIQKLKKKNIEPKIRLIGYSHGANVCLQLAKSKILFPDKQLFINEFILVGCPIHSNSNILVNDSIFKSVYNLYSKRDQIQVLDCFSSSDLFSRRRFFNKRYVTVNSKVTQASIQVRHVIGKPNQISKQYLFSKKLQRLRAHHYIKDESAGHIELWFLGWTPKHYRKQFVLYPYPILVFVPCIINALQQSKLSQNNTKYQLTVDVFPDFEEIIVKGKKKYHKTLFPYKNLSLLFEPIALRARPKYYTKESPTLYIRTNKKRAHTKRIARGIVPTKYKRLRNFLPIY